MNTIQASQKPSVHIQWAIPSDVPELLVQLRDFDKFASRRYTFYPGDELATGIVMHLILTQPFFVARVNSNVVGFICGLVAPHIFNPQIKTLAELFWWVDPAFRGSRAGLLLLEELCDWARQNVDIFIMTLEVDSPVNSRVLEKRGFVLREKNYILEM